MKKYLWSLPVLAIMVVVGAPGIVWLVVLLGLAGQIIRNKRKKDEEVQQREGEPKK